MTKPTLLFATALLSSAALFAADTPETLIEAGHFKKARSLVQAGLTRNPNDAHALYNMSRIKRAFGDKEAAIDLAQQAVKLDAKNSDYHCQVAELNGEKAQTAGMFQQIRLARVMKNEGETALSLNPKNAECLSAMVTFYLEAPGIVGGDKQKAREFIDRLLTLDSVEGNFAQVEYAQHEKQMDKIEGFYLKAVEGNPLSYRAHSALGSFYLNEKKFDLAARHAREALKIDPFEGAAYALLAAVYANQERWKELDAILDQAEAKVPDDLNPTFQAGRTLLLAGKDLPRAERYFRKYLTPEPEGGTPPLWAAHWRLGLVLEKEGRKPEAVSEIQSALSINPDFEPAKKDLKRLK